MIADLHCSGSVCGTLASITDELNDISTALQSLNDTTQSSGLDDIEVSSVGDGEGGSCPDLPPEVFTSRHGTEQVFRGGKTRRREALPMVAPRFGLACGRASDRK
jgi:hypothetical protein